MDNINDLIETAFDMDYLNFPDCPQTEFKSIGIVGGGTAGYFAALALSKCHPSIDITLIESNKIPVIGVGESTTSEIVPFLHRFLGFDPVEFFREVEPTFKFGIRFDWGRPQQHFNFNFFAAHHAESYKYEGHIQNANWPSVLMSGEKMPVLKTEEDELLSLLTSIPFAYHIDNKKLVSYLHKKVLDAGVSIVDATVENVRLTSDSYVESLQLDCREELSFDLFIDCTGFRSKLLGEALQTDFVSYESSLITDKAIAFELPNKDDISGYTSAITMNNGWCWKIPMQQEDHYGYVYSSRFSSEEECLQELEEKFGKISNHRNIEFRSGRHEKSWNGNVFALGNAYAFVEPLESTAIQTVVQSVMTLCRLMPNSLEDESSISGLNAEISASWDTFRWFLAAHYKFNKERETEFWKYCRENTKIGDAKDVVKLFNERAPLVAGNFGVGAAFGYMAKESLVFNPYSYDTILYGMHVVNKSSYCLEMSEAEYFARVNSYKELTDRSLSQHEFFKDELWMKEGLIEQLFQDPDSWINETGV